MPKFETTFYTLYPKLVKITQFLALQYRIPNIKYPEIPYIQNPWPTLSAVKRTITPEVEMDG